MVGVLDNHFWRFSFFVCVPLPCSACSALSNHLNIWEKLVLHVSYQCRSTLILSIICFLQVCYEHVAEKENELYELVEDFFSVQDTRAHVES
jgi:hypothetical protein